MGTHAIIRPEDTIHAARDAGATVTQTSAMAQNNRLEFRVNGFHVADARLQGAMAHHGENVGFHAHRFLGGATFDAYRVDGTNHVPMTSPVAENVRGTWQWRGSGQTRLDFTGWIDHYYAGAPPVSMGKALHVFASGLFPAGNTTGLTLPEWATLPPC